MQQALARQQGGRWTLDGAAGAESFTPAITTPYVQMGHGCRPPTRLKTAGSAGVGSERIGGRDWHRLW